MVTIAVCDDDEVILEYIYKKIRAITDRNKDDVSLKKFSSGNDVISESNENQEGFDILFLDIDMPMVDGFEVASNITKFNKNVIIIFLTSMEELVYESFKYRPFGFIRKSRLDKEINEVLNSAIASVEKEDVYQYKFKTAEGELKVVLKDIFYFECLNRTVYLSTKNKKHILKGIKFQNLENEFLNKGFISIHRSCIVNIKSIFNIEKLEITLENGKRLPISRYKIKNVKKAFILHAK